MKIQYYEGSHEIEMELQYPGKPFNPFENDDEEEILAMLIVREMTTDVKHEWDGENHLVLKLITK